MANQENYDPWYDPITEYRGQPINVRGKEIIVSFDLYTSQDGQLGWSKFKDGEPSIHPQEDINTRSVSRVDISDILSQIVKNELKMSKAPDALSMLLDNEDLVAAISFEIGPDRLRLD